MRYFVLDVHVVVVVFLMIFVLYMKYKSCSEQTMSVCRALAVTNYLYNITFMINEEKHTVSANVVLNCFMNCTIKTCIMLMDFAYVD